MILCIDSTGSSVVKKGDLFFKYEIYDGTAWKTVRYRVYDERFENGEALLYVSRFIELPDTRYVRLLIG